MTESGSFLLLYLTADGTGSGICTVLGTCGIGVDCYVPLVCEVVRGLLLLGSVTVQTLYNYNAVSLCAAVGKGDDLGLTLVGKEVVRVWIDIGLYGVVVVTVDTLEYGNTGSYTGSLYHFGMPEGVFFIYVDASGAYVTEVIPVGVDALGDDLFTDVTCVIAILVLALGEDLFTDVTYVVAVLVLALGEGLATVVTLVIVITVSTLGESLAAHVTYVVCVAVGAACEGSTADVTLVVYVLVGALGDLLGTYVTSVIAVAVSTL